ncbi:hypothetical protein [Cryobacterium melibiosiphilum]|uniref:hypothetical protein n=1 Tax=Cryobacterium melibiosiphilum TaxID=995039 RepID=UPI0011C21E12|nr:hypothetical protein [Cryobacterium melibiosiphilum]
MSVVTSMPYHRAVRQVSRWCAWYTRGVDADTAANRRDELASDLHEQATWADAAGQSPRCVARSILGRAGRGALADLSWSHAQRRRVALADPVALRGRRIEATAASLVLVAAIAVFGLGLYVLVRVGTGVATGLIRGGSATSVAVLVFTALAACGVMLLARRKTRFLGALWMILPTIGVIHYGLYQLYSLSATVGALMFSMPGWSLASDALTVGLVVYFAAATIWWWPARAARSARVNAGVRV